MKIAIGAAVLLISSAAGAVPVSFEFTAIGDHSGSGCTEGQPEIVVPPPYDDYEFANGTPISGTFTVETSTPGLDSYIYEYGVKSPGGKVYLDALTRFDLYVAGQGAPWCQVCKSAYLHPQAG